MARGTIRIQAIAAAAGLLALAAADHPSVFGQTSPGLWEVTGVPGSRSAIHQCLADVHVLAQFEHRGQACARKVVSNRPNETTIDYSCGPAGFGHSEVDLITPRSLRIETQGVSNRLPFNYVLEARRIGDCPADQSSRH